MKEKDRKLNREILAMRGLITWRSQNVFRNKVIKVGAIQLVWCPSKKVKFEYRDRHIQGGGVKTCGRGWPCVWSGASIIQGTLRIGSKQQKLEEAMKNSPLAAIRGIVAQPISSLQRSGPQNRETIYLCYCKPPSWGYCIIATLEN